MKRRVVSGTMLTLLFMGMLTLTLDIQSAKAEPTTITVPDDYEKIQWAIGNASVGDTIFVRAGTYYERVRIGKSLSLVGENKSTTFIDGEGTASPVIGVFAHNVTIMGFNIRNSRLEGYSTDSGIYVLSVENTTVVNNTISANINGIKLYGSRHDTVNGNTIFENDRGISAWNETGGSFIRNTISNNVWSGIDVSDSNAISILNNSVTSDYIALTYSNDIIVAGNMVSDSPEIGVNLWYSNSCSIYENRISDSQTGFHFVHCQENKIRHNNLLNNSKQVYLEFCEPTNVWDDGYPSGGNHWSDYAGSDANNDGIGDIPYTIDADNQDRYPLMNPWRERTVGVKVGDWARYNADTSWTGVLDPRLEIWSEMEWGMIEVTDIQGTVVTFTGTSHFKNGSELTVPGGKWDIAPTGSFGFIFYFIGANLQAGDRVYPSGLMTINETIARTYCGVPREINHLNWATPFSITPGPPYDLNAFDCYWDQASGILTEESLEASTNDLSSTFSLHVKIVETNLWEAPNPVEEAQELIQTIETWSLCRGTENSLTSKLNGAIHLLNKGNENGAIHKLMGFINQVEAQRGKKLTDDQADYLAAEAEGIISLIEG